MKFAALRHKKTPEFASIESFNETGRFQLYTHELPDPRPEDLTIEMLRGYYEQHGLVIEDGNFDDLEIKRYDFFEEGTIGADIRNKLSPIKTLLKLLMIYKDQRHMMDWDHKEYFENQIIDLIKECENSVTYLTELL